MRAQLLVGAVGCAAYAAVFVLDLPYRPLCPFYIVTGYWCPGCGSGRALHALSHGRLWEALSLNPVTAVAAPSLVVWWGWWVYRTLRDRPPLWSPSPRPVWVVLSLLVAFGVVRNLPGMAWLAP